ncbi:MAG: hypothetical protein WDM89_14285 [Rhizomicrobium sp.]
MSLSQDDDIPALATTAPSPIEKRDALGNVCFYLHFAVLIFIVAGWTIPVRAVLIAYLVFLPLVIVGWQFNKNSCILNNIESYLRYGTWRAAQNEEEGAWLMTLIRNVTGIQLKHWQVDCITYGFMTLLWFAGFSHLKWW